MCKANQEVEKSTALVVRENELKLQRNATITIGRTKIQMNDLTKCSSRYGETGTLIYQEYKLVQLFLEDSLTIS